MLRSKKYLLGVLVGALCIVVGLASIAFANGGWLGAAGEALGIGPRAANAAGRGIVVRMGTAMAGTGVGKGMGTGMGMGMGMGTGMGMGFASMRQGKLGPNPQMVLAYISGNTGTPIGTLQKELKSGKALEEIAAAYGIDWADIEKAMDCSDIIGEMSVERLEAAIDRVTANKERLAEQVAEFESRVPEYEAKIADIEDEALREFAAKRLDIMKQRCGLSDERLSIMDQWLELLQEELAYAKSR